MKLGLVSHVNGDGDLLEAWFKYYCRLGVSSFHLIVHGPKEENERLYALKDSYPVIIEDTYEGPFDSEEKKRRLDSMLARMRRQWLVLADSDEFVEFPYRKIFTTIRFLELAGKNALYAPMVQHLTLDGSLDTPEVVEDPFRTFPLCSIDLYQKMGVQASFKKYPLFYCTDRTMLEDGGNHNCPNGNFTSSLQGVTHHFKFRRSVSNGWTVASIVLIRGVTNLSNFMIFLQAMLVDCPLKVRLHTPGLKCFAMGFCGGSLS